MPRPPPDWPPRLCAPWNLEIGPRANGVFPASVRESALRLLPDQFGPGFRSGKTEQPDWSKEYLRRSELRTQVADLLKKAGTPIDDVDGDGLTPLMVAINYGDTLLAKWLVQNCADTKKRDKSGKTPWTMRGHPRTHRFWRTSKAS